MTAVATVYADAAAREPLALGRYRYSAVFDDDLRLPEHAGALLRSVFGLALRTGACSTGLPDCKACPLYRQCSYPALFATPPRNTALAPRLADPPNPYVIEPPSLGARRLAAGEPLVWHQVLIGPDALRQLPLVVRAWSRALGTGIGVAGQRVRGRLVDVVCVDGLEGERSVYQAAGDRALPAQPPRLYWPAPTAAAPRELHLDFDMPLRLQQEGHPLRPAELSPRTLVSQMLRRCGLMFDLHLGVRPLPYDARALVASAAALTDDRSALRWWDGARYSARQRQETPLGGVIGHWTLRGDVAPLVPWFWLGQWLHLGKAATMGLGAYRLTVGP